MFRIACPALLSFSALKYPAGDRGCKTPGGEPK